MSLVQPEPPSSDDFKPDPDIADILNDLDMPDGTGPHMGSQLVMRGGRASPTESVDEDYTTPPTTPVRELLFDQMDDSPSIRSKDKDGLMDQTFLQRVDPIKLPEFTMPSRKRSMVEPSQGLESRKVSRDGISHQFPRVYEVNHLEPGAAVVPSISNTRSFSSTTTASTARTTPNTSFYIDSPATSFDSTSAYYDPASLQLMQETVDAAAIRVEHLQFTAHDGPMDLDVEEFFAKLGPESVTTVPAPIRLSEEESSIAKYLDQHLISESPFGTQTRLSTFFCSC